MNETFAQRLRRIRKEKGLTQTALAKKCGLCRNTISAYEIGRIMPNLPTIEWLCDGLGVTASELLGF